MVRSAIIAGFVGILAVMPVDKVRAQGGMQFGQDRDALFTKCRVLARKAVRRGSRDRSRRIVQYTDHCMQKGGTL